MYRIVKIEKKDDYQRYSSVIDIANFNSAEFVCDSLSKVFGEEDVTFQVISL